MKNYDEKYLKQAVELLEKVDHFNYDKESIPWSLMDAIENFIQSYYKYQCQKDEKMHGDL